MDDLYSRLIASETALLSDPFWAHVNGQLDMIEASQPTTARQVLILLDGTAASAFFAGGGGDRELLSSLTEVGWDVAEYHAHYYWTARHPDTGATLEYLEGDVFNRTAD